MPWSPLARVLEPQVNDFREQLVRGSPGGQDFRERGPGRPIRPAQRFREQRPGRWMRKSGIWQVEVSLVELKVPILVRVWGSLRLGGDGGGISSHCHRQGASIEVCEGSDGHHFRYREAGTYRGAGDQRHDEDRRRVIAGTGGGCAGAGARERNFDVVAGLVAERVRKTRAGFGQAAAAGGRARGMRGRRGTSAAWSRRPSRRGGGIITVAVGGGVVAGRAPGDRLGRRGRAARVLRRAGLVPGAVRAVRRG